MAFDSIPGEPETAEFVLWCRERGITVVMPEEDPDPTSLDVVVVPGVAFTTAGERLGQGGGWYDRYLPRLRSTCLTVGVGFAEQVVDSLPTEAHDVMLDSVITDAPGDGGA